MHDILPPQGMHRRAKSRLAAAAAAWSEKGLLHAFHLHCCLPGLWSHAWLFGAMLYQAFIESVVVVGYAAVRCCQCPGML
jgi:hypothetical protein